MDVVLTVGAGAHSAYAELLADPPVRYHKRSLEWGAPLWGAAWKDAAYWKLRAARRIALGEPEAAPVPDWGMPIHSAQSLLRTRRPWVVDYEHLTCFTGFDAPRLLAKRARLAGLLDDARALLPWTEAAARATRALMPSLAGKVHPVLPAIAPRVERAPDHPEAPLVLFVGRHFHRKGGLETVEAFKLARESVPDARLLVVSDAPAEVQARAGPGVAFLPPTIPRDRLLAEAFRKASVFMMPTHFDTFGMVFLEAFAHGIPVLTLDTFAADEIVVDGVEGRVVRGFARKWFGADGLPRPEAYPWASLRAHHGAEERARIVRDLAEALVGMLQDAKARQRMGASALEAVTSGRFATRARNDRLRSVYAQAFSASS